MTYVWTLFDDKNRLRAVFSQPQLAFRSLERAHGIGLVEVVHRAANLWKIRVKTNGMFLCERRVLLTGTVKL